MEEDREGESEAYFSRRRDEDYDGGSEEIRK
jgi:hypothetical protein